MKLIDRAGKRFGRLVVVKKADAPKMWECLCDCGTTTLVIGGNLDNGSTRSCGCLALEHARQLGANREYIAKRAEKTIKHGHKRGGIASPEYKTWLGMKRRCYDPKYKDFPNWGGRGVTVCDRWRESFEAFFADMGPRPSEQHSIDRIDGSRGYEPGNCRWATSLEQGETKRNNIRVEVLGQPYSSVKAACRALGVGYPRVMQRIKAGYSVAEAFALGNDRAPSRRTPESYWPKHRRPSS